MEKNPKQLDGQKCHLSQKHVQRPCLCQNDPLRAGIKHHIVQNSLSTIFSSKKLCPFSGPLTATAQEPQTIPKLKHSSDTRKGPGLSLNSAQGQVGLRSQVRLLRAACSQINLMMVLVLNTMHEAKPIYSCVTPKEDNSHISGPLPKWSHGKISWLWWQLPPRLPGIISHSRNAQLVTDNTSVGKFSDFF